MDYNVNGKESEWNEAMLKARRLDEIQQRINFWKINPKGVTNKTFNFELLLRDIENLYGEGRSKYSSKEKLELDNLKILINKTIKYMPPIITIKKESISGNSSSQVINTKNYEMFLDLLYHFEMKVKDYNDDHGLTTKNRTTEGLFG